MKFVKTKIKDCFKIKNNILKDQRGSFTRNFCQKLYERKKVKFLIKQSNISENLQKGTLRGFHYQSKYYTENKIINCISGSIFNVVIDLRKKSKSYKKIFMTTLSNKNKSSILIPAGCANGFLTLEDNTYIQYLMSDYFEKNIGRYFGLRYNDKLFSKVKWPTRIKVISKKDLSYPDFE